MVDRESQRRERRIVEPGRAQEETTAPDDLARSRAEGEALLAAADRAMDRALSRDSATYLAQGRQTGGQ
jgi:hypothetical protein